MKKTYSYRHVSGRRRRGGAVAAFVLFSIFVLLLAPGCGTGDQAATTDTGGKLQITETSYDFGAVPVGETVEHQFEIRNKGTGPLQLGELSVKRLEGC
jgi:hypothetical protein